MTSAPPSPSIVSLPEPPVIVLAPVEPSRVMLVATALASILVKRVTLVEPEISLPALARLTLVPVSRTSVEVPLPPSRLVSEPW